MTLPQPQTRFVDSHLDEPGAEPRFEPELREILERLKEGVLRRVFRVRFVTQNRERDDEDAPLVGPNQFVKQLPFATLDAPNQSGFVFVAGVSSRRACRFTFGPVP